MFMLSISSVFLRSSSTTGYWTTICLFSFRNTLVSKFCFDYDYTFQLSTVYLSVLAAIFQVNPG